MIIRQIFAGLLFFLFLLSFFVQNTKLNNFTVNKRQMMSSELKYLKFGNPGAILSKE